MRKNFGIKVERIVFFVENIEELYHYYTDRVLRDMSIYDIE